MPCFARDGVVAAFLFAGNLSTYSAPLQISLLSLKVGLWAASSIVSASILATALAAMGGAQLGRTWALRQIAMVGFGLILVGNLGLHVLAANISTLFGTRIVAGAGSGIVLACAYTMVARSTEAEAGYGRSNGLALTLTSLLFILLTRPAYRADIELFYTVLSVPIAILAGTLLWKGLPGSQSAPGGSPAAASRSTGLHQALPLVVGSGLYAIICGGTYSLSGQAATRAGMDQGIYGLAISGVALVGIFASLAVGWMGSRWGREIPLLASCAGTFVALLTIVASPDVTAIALGLLGYDTFSVVTLSYITGLAAAMDPTGRLAASLGGFLLIPYSMGPALLGAGLSAFGWSFLAGVIVACGGPILLLMAKVTRQAGAVASRRKPPA